MEPVFSSSAFNQNSITLATVSKVLSPQIAGTEARFRSLLASMNGADLSDQQLSSVQLQIQEITQTVALESTITKSISDLLQQVIKNMA